MFRGLQLSTVARRVLISTTMSRCLHRQICSAVGYSMCVGFTPQRLGRGRQHQELLWNQKRNFWGVDVAFNRVDEERVRLAGPDRAAAEWILRNGGTIRWTTSPKHLDDYNMLPTTQFDSYKLEEIDLTATDVIGMGFEHLKDLHHVKRIKLHGVRTVGDDGLSHLVHVSDTLMTLEVSRCPMITEKGLRHLVGLKKLKRLLLYDLMEIRDLDSAVSNLRQQMPGVDISTEDPALSPPHTEEQ